MHNFSLLDDVRTIPWMLKEAGYRTALVGKKHVKPDALLPYDAWLDPEQPGIRDVAHMAHEAGRWIRAQNDAPFFLTRGFSDPHRDATGFGNSRSWPEVKREVYSPEEVQVPLHLPDLPAVRADLTGYYESVSRLDTGVGLVLQELEDSGHAAGTLVIYLSDNGRPFPGAKDNLYDAGLHLLLIIRNAHLGQRTLHDFKHRPAEELYDLRTDPDEVVNLAPNADHQHVVKALRADLERWRAATHDPWLPGITDPFVHAH